MSVKPGAGADRKGTRKDGLLFGWRWVQECHLSWDHGDPRNKSKKRRPCQSCTAELPSITVGDGGNFILEAVRWSSEYEACVEWMDHNIVSRNGFKTRLSAQRGAEKLLREFLKKSLKVFT